MNNIYCNITKVNEDERIVEGYASTEAMDVQGEIVEKSAIEEALPEYMRFGNIREMHQPSAVGKAVSATIDDKGLYLAVKVVDDSAWEKVKQQVYNGFSIGGKSLIKIGSTISKLRLTEISLVDRPANPEAVFNLWKGDDMDKVADREDVNPKSGEKEYGNVKFADEKNNKYPIDTEKHIRAAWNYINKEKNASKYDEKDVKAIKAKIISAWKDKIDKDGPPSAETKKSDSNSDIEKGKEVYDAASAMSAMQQVSWLLEYELYEAENEEMEDEVQITALKTAIESLKTFVISELQEDSEIGKKASDKAFDDEKTDAAFDDEDEDEKDKEKKAEKSDSEIDIEKAGASMSKANKAHLNSIIELCNKMMGEEDDTEKSAKMEDINKADGLDDIKKAFDLQTSEMAKMAQRIKELEEMPALAKGALLSVGKGEEIQKAADKPKTAFDLIKMAHSGQI